MHYEINVTREVKQSSGRKIRQHFFATAKRSITTFAKLQEVLKVIHAKFPESEGYEINVTRHETFGYRVSVEHVVEGN